MTPLHSALAVLAVLLSVPVPAMASAQDDVAAVAYANRQSLALVERSPARGWTVLPGGLRWRRVQGDGSGRSPIPGDEVTAHYAGSFVDGTEFDSSYRRGEPLVFALGQVIRGWQDALARAGVGDRIEIAIPYQLAYGLRGKGPIPGGATLLFTIDLLAVTPSAGD